MRIANIKQLSSNEMMSRSTTAVLVILVIVLSPFAAIKSDVAHAQETCPSGTNFDGRGCLVMQDPSDTDFKDDGINASYDGILDLNKLCAHHPASFTVSYDGANCLLTAPSNSKPFIFDKNLYLESERDPCPYGGQYDGANCFVLGDPSDADLFQYAGNFYYTAIKTKCPYGGQYDGANCFLMGDPQDANFFQYAGNFYYTAIARTCPYQPLPVTASFDGVNCFLQAPGGSKPFIHAGNLYLEREERPASNPCPYQPVPVTASYDGANCYLQAPGGSRPFIHAGNLYLEKDLKPTNHPCPHGGQFDGANCFVLGGPPDADLFQRAGNFYYTAIRRYSCPYLASPFVLAHRAEEDPTCILNPPQDGVAKIIDANLYIAPRDEIVKVLSVSSYITSTITDSDIDTILSNASVTLHQKNASHDGRCPVRFQRLGNVQGFSLGNGTINSQRDLYDVMGANTTYVKIVNAINWCGRLGTFAGCAGSKSFVVAWIPGVFDGALWAHEYGHTKGLPDVDDPQDAVMHRSNADVNTVNEAECHAFKKAVITGDGGLTFPIP